MATQTRSVGTVIEGDLYGAGAYHWSNLNNILTSNNTYATVTRNSLEYYSYSVLCTNFGFTIPAGSVINSVLVTIEAKADDRLSRLDWINLIVPGGGLAPFTAMGQYAEDSDPDQPLTSTDDTYDLSPVHLGGGNLWGYGWTLALVNDSDFGCAFDVRLGGGATISVDHVQITVDYTEGVIPTDECNTMACTGNYTSIQETIKSLIAEYYTGRSDWDGCIGLKLAPKFRFCAGLTDLSECGTKYTLEEAFKAALEDDGCGNPALRVFSLPVMFIEVL